MIARALPGLSLLLLCACSPGTMLQRLAPPEADQFSRTAILAVQRGNAAELLPVLTPELRAIDGTGERLGALAEYFPPGSMEHIELVGANVHRTSQRTVRILTYQVESSGQWALARVDISESAAGRRLDGMHVQRIEAPIQQVNAFVLRGKSAGHLVFLLLALCVAGFSIFAAARVAWTPMPRRWLWALLAVVGVGAVVVDWTTGQIVFRPVNLQLFGAALMREGIAGPWRLTVAFPLGALIALERRRRYLRSLDRAPGETAPPAASAAG